MGETPRLETNRRQRRPSDARANQRRQHISRRRWFVSGVGLSSIVASHEHITTTPVGVPPPQISLSKKMLLGKPATMYYTNAPILLFQLLPTPLSNSLDLERT